MLTPRSYNTASSSSLRYLDGPPPLPLPTQFISSSNAHNAPIEQRPSRPEDPLVSALSSSPSFVKSQTMSFERRIKKHSRSDGAQRSSSPIPPVPPLPSSSKQPRSPFAHKTVNVKSYTKSTAVRSSSPKASKAPTGSPLPDRKLSVRKKAAPIVSPSLHAELHQKATAEDVPALPALSTQRFRPERAEKAGINASTLSLGLGITFQNDEHEVNSELESAVGLSHELTGIVSLPNATDWLDSPSVVDHNDGVDCNSTAPNTVVPDQGIGADETLPHATRHIPTPMPSTSSESYDLALLAIDATFRARIEYVLPTPGEAGEAVQIEKPIRRGASAITLGRARSLRQSSARSAGLSVRSASCNVTSRSSPSVSEWLTELDESADPLRERMPSVDGLAVNRSPRIPLSDRIARQQRLIGGAELPSRSPEKVTPTMRRTPSFVRLSLFRNKSIPTLRGTVPRSILSQKPSHLNLVDKKFIHLTPERRVDAPLNTPIGTHTPRRAHTLKRVHSQQKQWWEHAIVVVGAAGPGAFH